MNRQFTGRHMAAILVAFFGVVIVVNLIMARFAVGTFGSTAWRLSDRTARARTFPAWICAAAAGTAITSMSISPPTIAASASPVPL